MERFCAGKVSATEEDEVSVKKNNNSNSNGNCCHELVPNEENMQGLQSGGCRSQLQTKEAIKTIVKMMMEGIFILAVPEVISMVARSPSQADQSFKLHGAEGSSC